MKEAKEYSEFKICWKLKTSVWKEKHWTRNKEGRARGDCCSYRYNTDVENKGLNQSGSSENKENRIQ